MEPFDVINSKTLQWEAPQQTVSNQKQVTVCNRHPYTLTQTKGNELHMHWKFPSMCLVKKEVSYHESRFQIQMTDTLVNPPKQPFLHVLCCSQYEILPPSWDSEVFEVCLLCGKQKKWQMLFVSHVCGLCMCAQLCTLYWSNEGDSHMFTVCLPDKKCWSL